jgi:putative restriction endonuclease
MVRFDTLVVGKQYDRPYLARLWGYLTYNAISRGVVTPRDQNAIVFFVTKEKQESLTQYVDRIDNDLLFWEGEQGHGSDGRIAAGRDEIHVFYRERHHQDFAYKGRAILGSYRIYSDRPSRFSFQLVDLALPESEFVAEPVPAYFPATTERSAIIASRIGQGQFRDESLRIWHTCCVSGFTKAPILVASHIKPWRVADNRERLDGYNSLLLVPTYDKLFDKGYIGFDENGRITISEKIGMEDIRKTGLDENTRLSAVPDKSMPYLAYHQQYIFDLVEQADAG